MLRQWKGHLTCVDQWVPAGTLCSIDVLARNAIEAGVAVNLRLINAGTVAAAAWWSGLIDYLYIDADHTFDAVTADLEAWWPHLRIGGLIAGDDYEDPYDEEIPQNVTRAWDTFEAKYGQAFERGISPGLAGAHGRPASRLIWGVKR